METKKISKACGENSRNEESEAGQVKIQHSGCLILNLPSHILAAILFRLPIKEIVFCKCVCKSFYAKISSVDFAQSEVLPIVRTMNVTKVSRILKPLEIEEDGSPGNVFLNSSMGCPDSFEHFHVCMDFDTQFKIPVRNYMVARDTINDDEEITLDAKNHGYKVVNSCNGLLCLSEPFNGKTMVVCNPFTGDFINLPEIIDVVRYEYIDCGLGYSPKTNQYKVVRMFELCSPPECHDSIDRLAQVHILGTRSWKNIKSAPSSDYKLSFPTYLNGRVHWFGHRKEKLSLMVSFDCEKEGFLPFSLPPLREANRNNVGMGVLEGCLCICDSSSLTSICVWVMKNYSVKNSWTRLFTIDMSSSDNLLYGLYQPIKYMKNGALLMFNYPRGLLIYHDPRTLGLLPLRVCPTRSKYEIVAHTPSFTSLKHVLGGCDVEVLNVYSRCAGLKLRDDIPRRGIRLCQRMDFFDFIRDCDPVPFGYTSHETLKQERIYEEYWWGKYEYCFSRIWSAP